MKLTTYLDKFDLLDRVESAAGTEWGALRKWNFTVNHRAKGRFGCCFDRKKLVEVTSEYYVGGKVKEEEYKDFINTLLHETAHAIVHERYTLLDDLGKIKAHGPEWKAVMRALGLEPKRCGTSKILENARVKRHSTYVQPTINHIYTCKDCGYQFKRTRTMKNWQKSWHRGCKRKPNRGMLIYTRLDFS